MLVIWTGIATDKRCSCPFDALADLLEDSSTRLCGVSLRMHARDAVLADVREVQGTDEMAIGQLEARSELSDEAEGCSRVADVRRAGGRIKLAHVHLHASAGWGEDGSMGSVEVVGSAAGLASPIGWRCNAALAQRDTEDTWDAPQLHRQSTVPFIFDG